MLFRWHCPYLPPLANHRDLGRDVWILELVRVSINLFSSHVLCFNWTTSSCRDFFPVILTFLRQLPVVGNILSLPYIRTVSTTLLALTHCFLTHLKLLPGGRSFSRFKNLCCIIVIIIHLNRIPNRINLLDNHRTFANYINCKWSLALKISLVYMRSTNSWLDFDGCFLSSS